MKLEDRIRQEAADKLRVVITGRKRNAAGFRVTLTGGYDVTVPDKAQALQVLLALARTSPVREFRIRVADRRAS